MEGRALGAQPLLPGPANRGRGRLYLRGRGADSRGSVGDAAPSAPSSSPLPSAALPEGRGLAPGTQWEVSLQSLWKLSPLLQLCLISLQTGLDLESKYFPLEIRERDKSIRTVTVKAIVSPIPCASAPGWGPKG